jgi:hypothetical protein
MIRGSAGPGSPGAFSRAVEEEVCEQFRRAWFVQDGMPSFKSIRQELRLRLATLGRTLRAVQRGGANPLASDEPTWIDLDFAAEVANAAELVNDSTDDEGRRWALLFDELEVAPASIRTSLMGSLRVPDTHLVMKLALSPYPGTTMSISAAEDFPGIPREGNDFDVVSLSNAHRIGVDRFGRQVLNALVRDIPDISASPEQLFGQSRITTPAAQWLVSGTAYSPGSKRMSDLAEYVRSDPSVLDYLERHGIGVDKIGMVKPDRRAAHLRKIAPLVALREYYSVAAPGKVRRRYRQRKTFEFYAGLATLLALSEGNPRSILYLFGPLLSSEDTLLHGSVSESSQAKAIGDSVASFRSLLKTIPAPTPSTMFGSQHRHKADRRGLLNFLDHIGEFFTNAAYATDFSPDPAGSFIVDSNTPDAAMAAIESGVNVGALIFVPDDDGMDLFGSARGKRLRLSYLLAAYHRLPLRLGRAVALSSIFEPGGGERVVDEQPSGEDQLFDLDEVEP